MKSNHMIGITPAHDSPNFALMRELGIKWVRQGYPFPFQDARGTLSPDFLKADELIEQYRAEGFDILCSFTGPGSVRYIPELGKTHTSAQHLNTLAIRKAANISSCSLKRQSFWENIQRNGSHGGK
jgi:hypothetical protein